MPPLAAPGKRISNPLPTRNLLGLAEGERFEVRDVQNLLVPPVLSGMFSSKRPTVEISLKLSRVTGSIGSVVRLERHPNPHTLSPFQMSSCA